jgi:hypothetical protein
MFLWPYCYSRFLYKTAANFLFGSLNILRIIVTDGDPFLAMVSNSFVFITTIQTILKACIIQVLDSLSQSDDKENALREFIHLLDNWHLLVQNFFNEVGRVPGEELVFTWCRRWLQNIAKRVEFADDAVASFKALRSYAKKWLSAERNALYQGYFDKLEIKVHPYP